MTWNFIKTNWFSIALGVLLVAAILQGGSKFSLGDRFAPVTSKTAGLTPEKKSNTTLGLASEPRLNKASTTEIDQSTATAFLRRFASVAISERKKFGVPASILLATAFLNSQSGMTDAVLEANNFFALPCSSDWEGESVTLQDRCVRKYETPWASWRDFSIFLSSQEWFGRLRKSAGKDWQKWASGMEGSDISTVAGFNQKMSEVISYYRLYELDQQ